MIILALSWDANEAYVNQGLPGATTLGEPLSSLIKGGGIMLAIGSDHGGFLLKERIKAFLDEINVEYTDYGTYSAESVDYPDFALKVARAVAEGHCDKGILCCGTGIGVAITANKVPGIRAAVCGDTFSARASREHNDANILALGERVTGPGLALDIVKVWLESEFQGGRHEKRLQKIAAIEVGYTKGE